MPTQHKVNIKAERSPSIIAHRGASAHAPENTMAAFRKAVDAGADGIELDVRLARDGVPVIFHDSTLDRIAAVKGKVSQFTAKELKKLDVGSWFNERYPDRADAAFAREGVPALAEVLDLLAGFGGLLYIELKCREEHIEPLATAVCDAIRESPLLPRIVVKSFKLRAIPHIKAMCPGVRTAALFAPKIRNILRKNKHMLRLAEDIGADEISIHYTLATRKVAAEAARRGLAVVIWTTDNARWMRRGAELGLKAIITNDPAKLIATRDVLSDPNRR